MTDAAAVRAAKTRNRTAVLGKHLGDLAFAGFAALQKVNRHHISGVFSQQVVNVPEQTFFFADVPFHTGLDAVLG